MYKPCGLRLLEQDSSAAMSPSGQASRMRVFIMCITLSYQHLAFKTL